MATLSILEEESYQERTKRLVSEGIPDDDRAWELNSPLDEKAAAALLKAGERHTAIEDLRAVEPLVYSVQALFPLDSLFSQASAEEVESELTLIMNAAIVRWEKEFFEQDRVQELAAKVRGAANIGLETALALAPLTLTDIHATLGLIGIYRLGLKRLQTLRRRALETAKQEVAEQVHDGTLLSLLDALKQPFPTLPSFFQPGKFEAIKENGAISLKEVSPSPEPLPTGEKPFTLLNEIEAVQGLLQKIDSLR